MGSVGHLLPFVATKIFGNRSRIDKVIAMVRVAQFFETQCICYMLSLKCKLYNVRRTTALLWVIFFRKNSFPVIDQQRRRHCIEIK